MNTATDSEPSLRTTPWVIYLVGDVQFRIRSQFGWHRIGDQEPYWTVTGEIEERRGRRWVEFMSGCIHEEIAKHFPQLAPTLRWHLSFERSGPMHYTANAIYWAEMINGVSRWNTWKTATDFVETFRKHVVFGAVEGEAMPVWPPTPTDDVEAYRRDLAKVVTTWCEARLPRLLEAMRRDTRLL